MENNEGYFLQWLSDDCKWERAFAPRSQALPPDVIMQWRRRRGLTQKRQREPLEVHTRAAVPDKRENEHTRSPLVSVPDPTRFYYPDVEQLSIGLRITDERQARDCYWVEGRVDESGQPLAPRWARAGALPPTVVAAWRESRPKKSHHKVSNTCACEPVIALQTTNTKGP